MTAGKINMREPLIKRFLKSIFPWKGDTFGQVLWKLIFLLALVVFIGAGTYLAMYYIDTHNTKQLTAALSDMIDENAGEEYVNAVEEEYKIEIPDDVAASFAKLYAENNDTFGWISIPQLGIDYVVTKADNNEKYLKTDFYGKSSRHGTIFADYRNTYDSDNIILYGHHMRDGTMFAALTEYKTLEGYKSAPVIRFDTVNGTGCYKVFAVMLTNAVAEDDNGYVFNYMLSDFGDSETFDEFIEQIEMRSIIQTDVDIKQGDKLLTLSTCDYDFHEERLVVVARLTRDGEETEVLTDNAYMKDNVRYPQIWYDKNGIKNPFSNYEQWTP